MATVLPNTTPGFVQIAAAVNAARLPSVGANFHLDASEVTITAAAAADLPTSLTLLNNAIGVFRFHFADTVAMKTTDSGTLPALGAAIDLATSITAYGVFKPAYTAHIASTACHYTADATNTLTAPTPTDLPSLITALNEVRSKCNAHLASAPAGAALRVVAQ